jgi:hypothetical protein
MLVENGAILDTLRLLGDADEFPERTSNVSSVLVSCVFRITNVSVSVNIKAPVSVNITVL